MKSLRALLAATLLAFCPWHHLKTEGSGQPPPIPPVPIKDLPVGVSVRRLKTGLFHVVPNKLSEVPGDLRIADFLGIQAVKITSPDSIEEVAPNGQIFKWVLTPPPERRLYAIPILDLDLDLYRSGAPGAANSASKHIVKKRIPDAIKHVIANRGNPVLSAGEAQLQGVKLVIDNHSGHYHPLPESFKDWALDAFVNAGFKLEYIEFHNEHEKSVKNYFKDNE
jgi:hypothetical protein